MASRRGTQLTVESHGKEGLELNIPTSLFTNHQIESRGELIDEVPASDSPGDKEGKVWCREQLGEQTEAIQLRASNHRPGFPFVSCVTLDR